MNKFSVALVGNPNAGKTTLFNYLTGLSQRVGNWAGVTVEKKTGILKLQIHQKNQAQVKQVKEEGVEIIDLPGIYDFSLDESLSSTSLDSRISSSYLNGDTPPNCLLNIVDAAHLERNLYLTTQLKELGIPMIIVLNMVDVAANLGIYIHAKKLAEATGCPVVETDLRRKMGLQTLKETLANVLGKSIDPLDAELFESVKDSAKDSAKDPVARYEQVKSWLSGCYQLGPMRSHLTPVLDKILLNRYLGLPIFFLFMYLMFEVSITVGGALQPLFNEGSRLIFVDMMIEGLSYFHWPSWLIGVFSEGIGVGLNTVMTFIPQVGLLFLCLAFLEDSGYMARAAFVMDRVMQAVGLPGKSFVPLIIGFGCNVPAIMAARTLDARDRLLTIIMSPFMSCGARLAIFAVFSTAFFPKSGAWVVFLLYFLGVSIAFLTALIVRRTILHGKSVPFIIELPNYHWPKFGMIFHSTWLRLKSFLVRAGLVIIPVCLIIGTLNTVKWNGELVPGGSSDSILSSVSQKITPIFFPMGIQQDNWPATVGLITGALAKEVVVGTMNTLYTQENMRKVSSDVVSQADSRATNSLGREGEAPLVSLISRLKTVGEDTVSSLLHMPLESWINPFAANEAEHEMPSSAMGQMVKDFGSPLAAFAFMLFVLLYVPCVSTIAVTAKEAGMRWAILSTLWSISIAYVFAVVIYQAGLLFGFGGGTSFLKAGLWIFGGLSYLLLFIGGMRWQALWFKGGEKLSSGARLDATNAKKVCIGCQCA